MWSLIWLIEGIVMLLKWYICSGVLNEYNVEERENFLSGWSRYSTWWIKSVHWHRLHHHLNLKLLGVVESRSPSRTLTAASDASRHLIQVSRFATYDGLECWRSVVFWETPSMPRNLTQGLRTSRDVMCELRQIS